MNPRRNHQSSRGGSSSLLDGTPAGSSYGYARKGSKLVLGERTVQDPHFIDQTVEYQLLMRGLALVRFEPM